MPHFRPTCFYLALLILVSSCGDKESAKEIPSVQGSWNLIEYVDYDGNADWTSHGDSIMYQKHITPNSFVWLNYDKKNERLIGTGGGTYDYVDGKYTEYIAFFYPPIESLIGQPIAFEAEFEEGKWNHTGFFINETTDLISNETQSDTVKIKEIWERTSEPANANEGLVGTWQLLRYRDKVGGEYTEFPEFHGSIKLITTTHFTWIQYDRQGDEVYATGSGTYTFNEDGYTEDIQMIYPENTGQLGETVQFNYDLNDNQWYHYGYIPYVQIDSGMIIRDSSLIDEYWGPFEIASIDELLL